MFLLQHCPSLVVLLRASCGEENSKTEVKCAHSNVVRVDVNVGYCNKLTFTASLMKTTTCCCASTLHVADIIW